MKRFVFSMLFICLSLSIFAQASGGQIKRNKANSQSMSIHSSRVAQSPRKTNSIPKNNKERIIQKIINNMVYVEGGTFTMGATNNLNEDSFKDEKPTHTVSLPSFYIGKYEVTQEEWEVIMDYNPSSFKGINRPVENVNWFDCNRFANKLNEITGMNFRLPTEAEWEYAAKGGKRSNNYKYSGSNQQKLVTWYEDNSNKTHNVGLKSPNELGLYDMSGNVWEWCFDWYGDYLKMSINDPTGPTHGKGRVIRGGSYFCDAKTCRVSTRSLYLPNEKDEDLGFRLVCDTTD